MKIKILRLVELDDDIYAIQGFSENGEIFFKPKGTSPASFYAENKGDVVNLDNDDIERVQHFKAFKRRKVRGSILGLKHFDNPNRRL